MLTTFHVGSRALALPTHLVVWSRRVKMNPAALIVCLGLVFGSGCRARYDASEPINAIPTACCKEGDQELQHFKGCRPDGRCKSGEPYWLRGAITCGPVDEAACAGARCCEYRTQGDSPNTSSEEESSASEPTPSPEDATSTPSEAPATTDPAPPSSEVTEPSSAEPSSTEPAPAEGDDRPVEEPADATTDRA